MTTKSQRRKEKRKRQRRREAQEKRRNAVLLNRGQAPESNARHLRRLARQIPRAWSGELPEDVAVFDDAVLGTLPPDLAEQVSAVREALDWATESRGEEALNRISSISRSSSLSEWRLFIRGFVSWMAGDTESASDAWRRLNPERRAGRVAVALMASLHSELERVTASNSNRGPDTGGLTGWLARLDASLLYHAKLLRRGRFDRAAIRVAEAGVRISEESRDLLLGPNKIKWLREFAGDYRTTEPELVAALEQTALMRAFAQDYSDLFEVAAREFVGPKHDRKNRLLAYFYYWRFTKDKAAQQIGGRRLDEYLTKDLPRNEELSEPLRKAIASQIHLCEAIVLIQPSRPGFFQFFSEPEDAVSIHKHLQASVQAYPANRSAYKAHVEWLKSKLEDDRQTKPKRKPLNEQLAKVMQAWANGLPNDAEPRLWLFDYLLENEQTEAARPHVDWLAASRQDDPRVRAAPWKWQLLEAMRLCRRKTWLKKAPGALDEAASQWPVWLPRRWLPYLRAAWTLRCGRIEEFEEQRQQICDESSVPRGSLADICMMLGAAQHMRVDAAGLKTLRAPVDAAVKDIRNVPLEELLCASGFFWDLHRTQFLYPAYRMHGGKFARETFSRLNSSLVRTQIDNEQVHTAVLWSSAHRFWSDGYSLKLPSWLTQPPVARHPMFAAARLNAFVNLRYHWDYKGYAELGSLLREAAPAQRDPYYRYWFKSLADELDEILSRRAIKPLGFDVDRDLAGIFGNDLDDDEDDELDELDRLDFDPECDCPNCRRAKRAFEAAQRQSGSNRTLF